VYRARQLDPVREVALKALPGAELMSAEARQRFKIEAEAMARLEQQRSQAVGSDRITPGNYAAARSARGWPTTSCVTAP
jgi:hypothetical protein